MIIGIGCDIIEVGRIEKALKKANFKEQVFTAKEIEYCEKKEVHKGESYAVRFATKEAVGKALGRGLNLSAFLEIEVVKDELGSPKIKLLGKTKEEAEKLKVKNIHVSLSHIKEFACSYIVAEG